MKREQKKKREWQKMGVKRENELRKKENELRESCQRERERESKRESEE